VAGGVPIITNIGQCLSANQITEISAILNGTSNFILSRMEEDGCAFSAAVTEAQKAGYAEADPTMDVDGSDAAQKLAILAHLAFGARVPWREIPRRGIETLDPADIRYAKELGYRIKLLAVARLVEEKERNSEFGIRNAELKKAETPQSRDSSNSEFRIPSSAFPALPPLELHVSPVLVKLGTPLAEVRGAYNAISVVGDAVGRVFFHGMGAGRMPTASAVVADLIDTVVGRTAITFRTLELWSKRWQVVSPRDPDKIPGRYYLRFDVDDRPGVMAEITGVLGRHEISIASVIQHEPETDNAAVVPLVIMTHVTTEGATLRAVREIDRLPCAHGPSVRMRVGD
jgi:homoserine dehydrogenase